MRYYEIALEAAGVGKVVPGVNTTPDVNSSTLGRELKAFYGSAGVDFGGHINPKYKKKRRRK
jgi:hypothetical protein